MANNAPGIGNDLRDALRRFADKLDFARRVTLESRAKARVVISIPLAIGETLDQSLALHAALQNVGHTGTISEMLSERLNSHKETCRNKPEKRDAGDRFLLPYRKTADTLRTLLGWAQADPCDPLLYPLHVMANVIDKLSTLAGEDDNHGGQFCSVCFRHIDGDGATRTCSLHRHDAQGADRKAYANASRRLDRYKELLARRRPMNDLKRFILDTSSAKMPFRHSAEWQDWVEQFDAHLGTSFPYAYQQISKHKALAQCQSFEEMVKAILDALVDGTPISAFLGKIDPVTGHKKPKPKELLGLLSRANLWFQVDKELETGVNRPRKIDKERLTSLNQSGKTTVEIAAELDVTQQAVSAALRRFGIKATHTRGRMRKPETDD